MMDPTRKPKIKTNKETSLNKNKLKEAEERVDLIEFVFGAFAKRNKHTTKSSSDTNYNIKKPKIKFINYTPHNIVIRLPDDTDIVFPSNGVARVPTRRKAQEPIDGIPRTRVTDGEIRGLPKPEEGIIYIVSSKVRKASDRKDLASPDTDKAIRDEYGQIIAVRGIAIS